MKTKDLLKRASELNQGLTASFPKTARDTIEKDAADIVFMVGQAMKRPGEEARWKFWTTWGMRDEYYVEVDGGEFCVGSLDRSVRGECGTDVAKLKRWLWQVFDIGESRGLSWDRER